MIRRPPRSTRTDTLFPYTTLFLSSDADIIAQQKVDLLKRVAAINRKQQEFRNVADQFGIEWRKEAKAGDAREKEAVAAVMARLDKIESEGSEERRVGKECVSTCRSRWSQYQSKKTNEDRLH